MKCYEPLRISRQLSVISKSLSVVVVGRQSLVLLQSPAYRGSGSLFPVPCHLRYCAIPGALFSGARFLLSTATLIRPPCNCSSLSPGCAGAFQNPATSMFLLL